VGLPVSLILIAVGAVLAFAIHQDPNPSVDVDVVGWILMAVGVVGLLLSLLWWERWGPGYWGWGQRGYADAGPYPARRRGYPRRRTVVEEDGPAGPPGPPPPDGPPPP
jgi:ABC-type transport system involved in cytochrome c biogenesis permease subunit